MRRSDGWSAAVVTSVALAGLAVGWLSGPGRTAPAPALALALAVVQGLVLLWRRERPVLVLAVATIAVVALGLLRHPIAGTAFGPLVATYAVGAYLASRWAAAAVVPAVVALALTGAGVSLATGRDGPGTVAMLGTTALLYGGVFVTGRLARSRRDAAEQRTRVAIAEERARIARELHDVVAHHVGVMVLHAGAGRRLVGTDPSAAQEAFAQIEASGREALDAMPSLVGSLRDGGSSPSPQPRLGDLERLVGERSAAGQRVALRVEGDHRPLPAAVELSAYRIVQEALTNASRHAGPARVDVVVRYRPGALEVSVEDDGRGVTGPGDGGGFGLTGIRERVSALGGTCEVGPRPGGGFAVRAVLPLTEVGAR